MGVKLRFKNVRTMGFKGIFCYCWDACFKPVFAYLVELFQLHVSSNGENILFDSFLCMFQSNVYVSSGYICSTVSKTFFPWYVCILVDCLKFILTTVMLQAQLFSIFLNYCFRMVCVHVAQLFRFHVLFFPHLLWPFVLLAYFQFIENVLIVLSAYIIFHCFECLPLDYFLGAYFWRFCLVLVIYLFTVIELFEIVCRLFCP